MYLALFRSAAAPLFALPLLLTPLLSAGQATKKVKTALDRPRRTEVYSVLQSDKTVKHGTYQLLSFRNQPLVTGHYTQGRKDSVWSRYDWNGKNLVIKGTYQDDQRVGVWELYNDEGELASKYDFSTRQLVVVKPALPPKPNAPVARLLQPAATGQTTPDTNPFFLGGDLFSYMADVRYPSMALRNQVDGVVKVAFTIDQNGQASGHHLTQGIGSGCDEEAMRVVKSFPNDWLPAYVAGQPVAVEYEVPITFAIL